jgi:hypothetical protein
MTDRTLSQLYDQFTPSERMRLLLAAEARGDTQEAERLSATCPRLKLVGADPAYEEGLVNVSQASLAVLTQWIHASHQVLSYRNEVSHCATAICLCEEVLSARPQDQTRARSLELFRDGQRAAAEQWVLWSAVWIGVESGLERFCTETDLTRDWVFALVTDVLPSVIEEAREELNDAIPANRDTAELIYDCLRRAWPSEGPAATPALSPKEELLAAIKNCETISPSGGECK